MDVRRLKQMALTLGMAGAMLSVAAPAFAKPLSNAATPAHASGFWDDVAGRLGVNPSALEQAIRSAELDRVHAMQKNGTITQQQADSLTQQIQSGTLNPALGLGKAHPRRHLHSLIPAAAKYLGMTPEAFLQALNKGQTPAQIAVAHGKTANGLKAALVQDVKTRLDAAVKAGQMTPEQETHVLRKLNTHLDHWMQHPQKSRKPKTPSHSPS